MKKMPCGGVALCALCFMFVFAEPVFGQDVYLLPTSASAANLIAAIKAQAKESAGVQVEVSPFIPGTTTPAGIIEVIFSFEKPAAEGGGIFAPWLVALLPADKEVLVFGFVVQKRFSADYDRSAGLKGDPRVYGLLEKFLEAVYVRLDEPQGP